MEWDDRPLDARDPVTGRDGRDDGAPARGVVLAVVASVVLLLAVWALWVLARLVGLW